MSETLRSARPWLIFAGCVLIIFCLSWAQAVLVPLALAVLLTFLLTPSVTALERWLGRVPAVLIVVVLVLALVGALAYGISVQLGTLASELPHYRHNIRQKIADIRGAGKGGALAAVQETVKDIQAEIEKADPPAKADQPVPVVQAEKPPDLWSLPASLGPYGEALGTAGLVLVLVIFMLLERQQMRNRLIRMIGDGHLTGTTRAFDEAGSRMARYLLMQSLINTIFGIGVGIGLVLIGVPHALLWALLAAALRFIPYVGPWIAALAPILLSLAAFEGWWRPLLVIGLFVVLELFTNLVLETLLYADAAGVSEVGLLVAVAFWTWLWGPLGLLMSTPLTVCLVVLGRHVPWLEFVGTLLGSEPVLEPGVAYYQRLLAHDFDEATDIVEEYLKTQPADGVFDAILVPALVSARRDRASEKLSEHREGVVFYAIREVLDEGIGLPPAVPGGPTVNAAAPGALRILGCAASGEDEIAVRMFRQLLDPTRLSLDVASSRLLSSEVVALVAEHGYAAVCVAALPPGGVSRARYLVRKLRASFPDLKILVGRWGSLLDDEQAQALRTAGADEVGASLIESRTRLAQLMQALPGAARDSGEVAA